jgi:hypothetical protein
MTALRTAVIAAVALAVGGLLGAALEARRGEAALNKSRDQAAALVAAISEDFERRIDAIRSERDDHRRDAGKLNAEVEELRGRLRDAEARKSEATVAGNPPDPRVQTEAVERLASAARAAIARGDGAAAIEAVRELADVVPEGRAAAMALVVELDEARDALRLTDAAWSGFLAGRAVADLLGWSLGRPAPEAFRELAAEEFANVVAPDVAAARLREALTTETDEDAQRAMVDALAEMSAPSADAAMTELFADQRSPVPVRVRIATHLSRSEDGRTIETLRAAAATASPVLASGIRAALSAREATESGFMVTGFVNGSTSSRGLEVGDLLVSYDGRSAAEELNAAVRDALKRDGPVKVELLRAGARVKLDVAPGWLGLIGRVARAPDRR